MTGDFPDIEELKAKIGVDWEPAVYEIEKGMIRRFAQAIGDPNPRWQDENKPGGIMAPPTFITVIGFDRIQELLTRFKATLHASTEFECYRPVKPGDILTIFTRIDRLRERQGQTGRMVFLTFETVYKNSLAELVGTCRQTIIGY